MSALEEIRTAIPKLSVAEKLQTMETLWQSLSSRPEAVESPAWHENELRDREQDIESGKSKFIDWEKAKAEIRGRTS
jgi:putative addiction module component (TIGR02574 family)